jgi:hypothetical protein
MAVSRPLLSGVVTLDLPGLSGIAARIVERKVYNRLRSLTEDEVRRWRSGAWRIADDVIERYRDRLLENRALVLSAMDMFTPQEISEELVRRRPDLEMYWRDEVFSRRMLEEKDALKDFLEKAEVPLQTV